MCNGRSGKARALTLAAAGLVAIGLASAWGIALAGGNIWRETMTVELPVHERDSRARVRDLAYEDFRMRAARKVGSVVEATMQTDGQKLSEEVRTVGVSLVQIENSTESVRVDKQGAVYLKVTALVQVDQAELERRAEQMRLDVSKLERIRKLSDQNEVLRQTIAKLSQSLIRANSSGEASEVLRQHAETMHALGLVLDGVGHTFRAGTLTDLAAERQLQIGSVRATAEQLVLDELMRSPVTLRLKSIEADKGGYAAKVVVGWKPNMTAIARAMSVYLPDTYVWDESGSPYLRMSAAAFRRYEKSLDTRTYFDILAGMQVEIDVSVAGSHTRVPVLFQGDNRVFDAPCGQRVNVAAIEDWVAVCVVSQQAQSSPIKGMPGGRNPVSVPLTAAQADDATAIDATWVMTRRDGSKESRRAVLLN